MCVDPAWIKDRGREQTCLKLKERGRERERRRRVDMSEAKGETQQLSISTQGAFEGGDAAEKSIFEARTM